MLDIKYIRENPDKVKENIKRKFQDKKLPLVDEIIELDRRIRDLKGSGDDLRKQRNDYSSSIGAMMRDKRVDEANELKSKVVEINDSLSSIEKEEAELSLELKSKMMLIPQMMDASVPIGADDSCNVENERFGDPVVPDYEIPYHADIIASFNGLDKESAGRVSGEGFYYLCGDIARLHSACYLMLEIL